MEETMQWNATAERDSHHSRRPSSIFSRDEHEVHILPVNQGIQIDESDEHDENARLSMRESLAPDSNITSESMVQYSKHRDRESRIERRQIPLLEAYWTLSVIRCVLAVVVLPPESIPSFNVPQTVHNSARR
jgi:hypothetical protein